jgi:hypothetical protein
MSIGMMARPAAHAAERKLFSAYALFLARRVHAVELQQVYNAGEPHTTHQKLAAQ